MHRGNADEALTGDLAPVAGSRARLHCKYCDSDRVSRVFREGFLQERIYSLFGFYPWRCKACGATQMFHQRHRSRSGDRRRTE
jgi:hypothetical protein